MAWLGGYITNSTGVVECVARRAAVKRDILTKQIV